MVGSYFMKKILRKRDALEYVFSPLKEPELVVEPEELFEVETEDANMGKIRTPNDLPVPEVLGSTVEKVPWEANPVTGPIYVEGAERGDVLTVEILDVIPAEQGYNMFTPDNPLSDSVKWAECKGPEVHIIKHLPGPSGTTSDGKGTLDLDGRRVTWDLKPFIGTIATVPDIEIQSSLVGNGHYGGNMDCRDVCKGSKIYLPVYHRGALLYLGDVHATQGDSEFCGVADETRADVTLKCGVIKNRKIDYPRIEKPDSIIQICCFKPLSSAIKQAILMLMDWLVTDYGMSRREAYIHSSVNPDFRVHIYQMVDLLRIQYTVGAEIPKKYLPST